MFEDNEMKEIFIFETEKMLGELEEILIDIENSKVASLEQIDEIFRIMHTIKGSCGMMEIDEMMKISNNVEDLFSYIRQEKITDRITQGTFDVVLDVVDYFNKALVEIKNNKYSDVSNDDLVNSIINELSNLKNDTKKEKVEEKELKTKKSNENNNTNKNYSIKIFFDEDSKMENVRAYKIIEDIKNIVSEYEFIPKNILDDETQEIIKENGFILKFKSKDDIEKVRQVLDKSIFINRVIVSENESKKEKEEEKQISRENISQKTKLSSSSGMISVDISKLDKLMDLVGEIVISQMMVISNPEVKKLKNENFKKASRQLRKLTDELQDTVLSVRMVPVKQTFQKMNRIVRDMSKKLDKNVVLEIYGEETEIDKSIIDGLADPLMHMIRNSLDHGIEDKKTRKEKGKNPKGKVILEARNEGKDIYITVSDDGKGLDKESIYEKAFSKGIIDKNIEDMSDREIYNLVFEPGLSTKYKASEFSGRGVGMDVVRQKVDEIGGNVEIDSKKDKGSKITIKIPLTLAIIDGMGLRVGSKIFTIPTTMINKSFRINTKDIFKDINNNEMIMQRNEAYPIIRINKVFDIEDGTEKVEDGIVIAIEDKKYKGCIFVDELIGEQQIVVKPLPEYVNKNSKLAGCTILGNGNISLILDVVSILEEYYE